MKEQEEREDMHKRKHGRRRNPSGHGEGMDILLIAGLAFLAYQYIGPKLTTILNNSNFLASVANGDTPAGLSVINPLSNGPNSGFEGLGRTYVSGMGNLGTIGQGYNINETFGGDASRYELARKFNL